MTPLRRLRLWAHERSLITLVLAAIIAGSVQSILKISAPSVTAFTLIDDALFALAAVALISRRRAVSRMAWIVLGVWLALIAIASVRSAVGFSTTLEMARQIAIPAVLIVIGLALTKAEWRTVATLAFWVAAANAAYAVIEIHLGRIFDPGAMASATDRRPHGIPASYFYWDSSGAEHLRAGGLVLNPPVAGIVIATGLVLAWWVLRGPWRIIAPALMLYPLYLTNSRAGMVLVAAGLLFPLLLRVAGRWVGTGILFVAASVAAVKLAGHGDSLAHVRGFTTALAELPTALLGHGFGQAGNFVKRAEGGESGSESLIGIAISALGIPGLVIIAALIAIVVLRLYQARGDVVLLALFLGALAAAIVSESVSALNGTIPLWVAGGAGLAARRTGSSFPVWPQWALLRHPTQSVRALTQK